LQWETVKLARDAATARVTVPAGAFDVQTCTAEISGDHARTWKFAIETAEPHRIIQFERSDGERGELVASQRLKYWELNAAKFLPDVAKIGLTPRPPRTP
jgi:hypothetical protein